MSQAKTTKPRRSNTKARNGGHPSGASFPIVGVGASAGGLEAFSQLLGLLPAYTGMSFVLIQHLDPTHPSYLLDAIAKAARMPCRLIEDGMVVAPDQVYVIPPSVDVGLLKGAFTLLERPKDTRPPARAVDFFFQALAADQRNQAIGVVLSGTGTDGTEGLRAIKAEGGVAFAQEPSSAKFGGMPANAIAAGVVDFVGPVPELARVLQLVGHHPYVQAPIAEESAGGAPGEGDEFRRILFLLRSQLRVDFSDYKPATVRRRLGRRMALRQQPTLRDYLGLLQEDAAEVRALYEDLLVDATSFFRDPEVWDCLRERVLPELVKGKPAGGAIRVWVPGCSTGEEAYSIAICLLEILRDNAQKRTVQIFATDVSDQAIAKARTGFFHEGVSHDLSPARLQAFFTRVEGGYQISKAVRDLCVFVRHNLASDPPFSKLDLICCRNLLIYFNPVLQARAIATFHFALQVPGFLLVGKSESIVASSGLFTPVDKESNIFARSRTPSTMRFAAAPRVGSAAAQPTASRPPRAGSPDLLRQAENLLLGQYVPPGVVINDQGEILQFHGRTGPYLEPAPGQPQLTLFKMARGGLLADLRTAVAQAKKTHSTVRRSGVRVKPEGGTLECDVIVTPLPGPPGTKEGAFIVLFENSRPAQTTPPRKGKVRREPGGTSAKADDRRVAELEAELEATKEYLQSIADEQVKTNDELTSANEELVSSNEELQSLNEELETAKEELQSTNEELVTLNDELQLRNSELNSVNGDLMNVMNSVEIPVIIVDGARRIRRFTPKAVTLINVRASDVGRPFDEIKTNLAVENLDAQIAEVVETVSTREFEVQDRGGRWYRLQIRPYLSIDKKVDGAVMTVIDIDALKRALGTAEWARDYAASIVEAVQTPLVVLDEKLAVLSANQSFYETFGGSKGDTEGRQLFELGGGHWNVPALRSPLEEMLAKNSRFNRLEIVTEPAGLGRRVFSLAARPIQAMTGTSMLLLSIDDVTRRKRDEEERSRLLTDAEDARTGAETANRAKDVFLAILSHELRTPLSSLLLQAQMLRKATGDSARVERASEAIERAARAQAQLIDDLLDVSRIASGKLKVDRQVVSLASVVGNAMDAVRPAAEAKSLKLELAVDESLPPVSGDPSRLQQIVLNLLTNAIKFTPVGGRIALTLDQADARARIRVSDTGLGIEPDFLPHVFDTFAQADPSRTRTHGGLGLGMSISRHLAEMHGGTIRAESAGKGAGATFTVSLPLLERPQQKSIIPNRGPPAETRRRELRSVRLLVVEDEPSTREALAQMLALAGAEIKTASSAAEAMEVFEDFAPQVLICDIAMPDEDGVDLLRRIRALGPEHGGDVPAVALTALAGEEDRQRSLSAGFQLHLVKPLGIGQLVDVLTDLLPEEGRPRRDTPSPGRHESG